MAQKLGRDRISLNGLRVGDPFFVVRIRRRIGDRDRAYIVKLVVRAVSQDGTRLASASQKSKTPVYDYAICPAGSAVSVLRPSAAVAPFAFASEAEAVRAVELGIQLDLNRLPDKRGLSARARRFMADLAEPD